MVEYRDWSPRIHSPFNKKVNWKVNFVIVYKTEKNPE